MNIRPMDDLQHDFNALDHRACAVQVPGCVGETDPGDVSSTKVKAVAEILAYETFQNQRSPDEVPVNQPSRTAPFHNRVPPG